MFAEPLDGPITLGSMPPGFQDGNSSFATTFANSGGAISAPGSNVNITIGSAGPAANLQSIGIVTGTTAVYGPFPMTLARGAKTTVIGAGTGIDSNSTVTVSSPKITVAKGSVTFGGATCADLTVASDAVPGAADIMTGGSIFAGGIVVATNPTLPSNGVTDGAAFNQGTNAPHFAPGSLITLWGTDFLPAGGFAAASDMSFLPTQLAGTSVKIGNLLAPLYFVSPGQINATIPYELTAAQLAAGVDVTVITGTNTQSPAVHVTVASSAPRIMMNLSRFTEKMGLIQKWMPPPAASYPIADDKTPITAGDYLIIWSVGLGMATGPNAAVPISGTNYDPVAINGVLTPNDAVTVTIAGRSVAAYSAALSPQYPSIAQVAVQVPSGLPTGLQPLTISTKSGSSNTAMILIQ